MNGRFGKVGVLFGGKSAEREISMKSGTAVLAALKRSGVDAHAFDPAERNLGDLATERFDRVFIVLHGRYGEDGTIQGALDLMGIPYTGSGVLASSLCMDKWRTKLVWQAAGLPTADFLLLEPGFLPQAVVARLGLPLFVKPACEGSSIGVTKVKSVEDLAAAYVAAAKYDPLVLAERYVDGAEVQFAVVGDRVLPSVRVEPATEFYDCEAKYFRNDTRYHCPGLPDGVEHALHALVRSAFSVLACRGWGRLDLILDAQGHPFLLEMNTIPGMTDHSLVPMSARAAGIGFDELCVEILETARAG